MWIAWTGTVEFHRDVQSVSLSVRLKDVSRWPRYKYDSMDDSLKESIKFLLYFRWKQSLDKFAPPIIPEDLNYKKNSMEYSNLSDHL